MSKYLNLTYKFVWIEYLDRESIDILSILNILSIVYLFRHLLLIF